MLVRELACIYTSWILYDDGIHVTAEKIATLVKAANLIVESYWPSLFAKLCKKRNIEDLIVNFSCGGGAAAPVGGGGATPAAAEEKKEAAKEESDEDMGFSFV
ncbi:60S acidic ribosomal protein P1-like [Coffea eugenioides]|uniref:60S acidic ribosomal protein P1-like n=1 Tax=Coffea eugenioides TaxID=49369 RepID=UPI000F60EDAA|nr:60S acidic ribosomal protein P1-like [Coffea eugenioides]